MPTKRPAISVVCTLWNIEKFLHFTLDSLMAQTFQDAEFLLIDDGSKDSTPDICAEYVKKDKRFKYIAKQNGGPGHARNFGLDKATGEYVIFMDHDDLVDPNWLNVLYGVAQQTGADITFCHAQEMVDDTGETKSMDYPTFSRQFITLNQNWRRKLSQTFLPPWCKLMRRSIIKEHNIRFAENGNKFDDVLFHFFLIHHAKSAAFVDKILYTHRYFPESISGQRERDKDMHFDSLKTFDDLIKKAMADGMKIRPLVAHYLHHCFKAERKVASKAKYTAELNAILSKYGLHTSRAIFCLRKIRKALLGLR